MLRTLAWHPAVRIIPTRFPSINLFDRVASADDFDALYVLEAMTNPRVRNEVGDIALVPLDERLYGPGSGPIMAAFTHLNPQGSRFSDGSYGVFYAAKDKTTAIAETAYHQARFLRDTNEAPMQLQMRAYHVEVAGRFHDIRRMTRYTTGILICNRKHLPGPCMPRVQPASVIAACAHPTVCASLHSKLKFYRIAATPASCFISGMASASRKCMNK